MKHCTVRDDVGDNTNIGGNENTKIGEMMLVKTPTSADTSANSIDLKISV